MGLSLSKSWYYHWEHLLRVPGSIIGSISFEILGVSLGVYPSMSWEYLLQDFCEYHREYLRRGHENFIGIISFDVLGVSLGLLPFGSWRYHWEYLFRGFCCIIVSISSMSRKCLFQYLGSITGSKSFDVLAVSLRVSPSSY